MSGNSTSDSNTIKVVFDKLKITIGNFLSPTVIVNQPVRSNNSGWHIKNNSPVIVAYVILSLAAFWLKNTEFGRALVPWLSLPRDLTSVNDTYYLNFMTYIFGYDNWDSLLQNITFLLLLGPLVEKKYSSKLVFLMVISTAALSGVLQVLFYGSSYAGRGIGGTCIVYMLILVASATNIKSDEIPFTLILLIVFLLSGLSITNSGNYHGLLQVIGGICGFIFAIVIPRIFPNIRIVS